MIADLERVQSKKGKFRSEESSQSTTTAKSKSFANPFVDISLLRDYLNGDGNNVNKLADDRYLSPGQVRSKINSTARAITSFLNENIDESLLFDIYKHKNYFLKSIVEYNEKKNFYNPHNFQQNIFVYFDTISDEQKMLLLQELEDRLQDSKKKWS